MFSQKYHSICFGILCQRIFSQEISVSLSLFPTPAMAYLYDLTGRKHSLLIPCCGRRLALRLCKLVGLLAHGAFLVVISSPLMIVAKHFLRRRSGESPTNWGNFWFHWALLPSAESQAPIRLFSTLIYFKYLLVFLRPMSIIRLHHGSVYDMGCGRLLHNQLMIPSGCFTSWWFSPRPHIHFVLKAPRASHREEALKNFRAGGMGGWLAWT